MILSLGMEKVHEVHIFKHFYVILDGDIDILILIENRKKNY